MRRIIVLTLTVMLLVGLWSPARAGEPAAPQPQLTLNDAIKKAMENSKSIQKSQLSVDKAKESRDIASDKLDYTPVMGGGYEPATEAAWYNLLSADISWEMSKKSYSAEEDSLVLNVCQKYWNVQKSIDDLKYRELSASVAELSYRRVQAMVRLGMTPPESPSGASPQAVLATSEKDLAQARSDLTKARNKLKTDYEALNQLLGLLPEDRPVLVDEPKFEPVKVDDLNAAVQRVLEESPKIWQAEESAKLAQYSYELMYSTGSYKPYEIRKIEQQQAEIDAMSARDAVKLATRNLYYSVQNLEYGLKTAENALAGAEEALRVAKLQYDLGMITKESLVKTEASLALARETLKDLTRQHAYAKLAFYKPWAASSGGSSTSSGSSSSES